MSCTGGTSRHNEALAGDPRRAAAAITVPSDSGPRSCSGRIGWSKTTNSRFAGITDVTKFVIEFVIDPHL